MWMEEMQESLYNTCKIVKSEPKSKKEKSQIINGHLHKKANWYIIATASLKFLHYWVNKLVPWYTISSN